jgi:hypothetical protein
LAAGKIENKKLRQKIKAAVGEKEIAGQKIKNRQPQKENQAGA